jgi:hypothetical protein
MIFGDQENSFTKPDESELSFNSLLLHGQPDNIPVSARTSITLRPYSQSSTRSEQRKDRNIVGLSSELGSVKKETNRRYCLKALINLCLCIYWPFLLVAWYLLTQNQFLSRSLSSVPNSKPQTPRIKPLINTDKNTLRPNIFQLLPRNQFPVNQRFENHLYFVLLIILVLVLVLSLPSIEKRLLTRLPQRIIPEWERRLSSFGAGSVFVQTGNGVEVELC